MKTEDQMDKQQKISQLLTEAGKLHHDVYRIVDGDDPDWASWYADWLINLSELPKILGKRPVRSQLIYQLVDLGNKYENEHPKMAWQDFYAQQLVKLIN